jgi:hypothetical protein
VVAPVSRDYPWTEDEHREQARLVACSQCNGTGYDGVCRVCCGCGGRLWIVSSSAGEVRSSLASPPSSADSATGLAPGERAGGATDGCTAVVPLADHINQADTAHGRRP